MTDIDVAQAILSGDGYLCPVCVQLVLHDNKEEHLPECPMFSNLWDVEYGHEMSCALCGFWMTEGDRYRRIPLLVYPDSDAELESSIGIRKPVTLEPVCITCTTLREVGKEPVVVSWDEPEYSDPTEDLLRAMELVAKSTYEVYQPDER